MTKAPHRRAGDVPSLPVVLLFNTRRRLTAQRMNRTRAVYVWTGSPVLVPDDLTDDEVPGSMLGERLPGRRRRAPRSSVGSEVGRPLGDALMTVQLLRSP